uniref:Ig-like domain-containing protein n=1 Tax=Oncorhynchus tshawytscha TaxID=74940 RepID=A0A8C8BT71_ONCTS
MINYSVYLMCMKMTFYSQLFCNFCSLSLSDLNHVVCVSPPPLMVVHSGEHVTLQCINVLKTPGHVGWFKQVNGSEPLCITSMWSSVPTVHHQNGFQGKSIKMFMTDITIFLTITEVDVADSGLYFCGMLNNYFIFTNATVLKVQGNLFNKLSAMKHKHLS